MDRFPLRDSAIGRFLFSKVRVSWLFDSAAALAILCPLLGLLGGFWWIFDLLAHFRLQYLVVLMVTGLYFLIVRKWIRAFICLAAMGILAIPLTPYFRPIASGTPPAGSLKIVSFNVLKSNGNHSGIRDFLLQEDADLIVVMEVDRFWLRDLALTKRYPYAKIWPRDDNFGLAVFSKIPLESLDTLKLVPGQMPTIDFTLRVNEKPIHFLATHPRPPVSAVIAQNRNTQLAEIARITSSGQPEPQVVLGDLNLTPFSVYFARLLKDGGLQDSALGFGLPPTWRAGTPLAIPIDHCLISPGLTVLERRIGPRLGSDHSPLIVRLGIR